MNALNIFNAENATGLVICAGKATATYSSASLLHATVPLTIPGATSSNVAVLILPATETGAYNTAWFAQPGTGGFEAYARRDSGATWSSTDSMLFFWVAIKYA